DGCQPICESIIGVDREPGEPRSHPLVTDLAVWIASAFPLHWGFPLRGLNSVFQTLHARHLGAAGAAVKRAFALHAVPDDLATAMRALGRKRVNGALERIEYVGLALHCDGERLVVIVAADLALRHRVSFFVRRPVRRI